MTIRVMNPPPIVRLCWVRVIAALIAIAPGMFNNQANAESPRQFLGFEHLRGFRISTNSGGIECLSAVIMTRTPWTELIVSWNVRFRDTQRLRVEARPVGPAVTSKFYTLGLWSGDPSRNPRQSVNGQKDGIGNVLTDTLVLRQAAPALEVRLTLEGGAAPNDVRFLGLSVLGEGSASQTAAPDSSAWDRVLDVPRKSQLDYPGGENEWCSPTTIAMILNYWSIRLSRPDLRVDVPSVVEGVHDPQWPGTGNWPFNTAFAGSFPGLRSYVTRLDDISELERWISAGYPVATSLSYSILRGKADPGNGHLVVLVGFNKGGDVVINDPGTRLENVRRTFPRDAFIRAWAVSKNTIYVVIPEDAKPPFDPLKHWHHSGS